VKVRIGLQSARELEIDVADGDAVVELLEGAKEWIVWVEDSKGRRHGVVVDKIAFVEVDARPAGPGVGFGS
jgi:hypothetical protein